MRTTKEEQRRILNMDIRAFIDDNIQECSIKTRLIKGILNYPVEPLEKVKDLWFTKCGRLPLHPLRYFRNVGRKCEIEFESALEKYDLYFGEPIDKILGEEYKNKMKVVIFDSEEKEVYTFDNWIIPLPLVGDMVLTPLIVKIDGLDIECKDGWIVKERSFNCEENTVILYCELMI